ncbi:MAG: hypothetical protein ACKO37_00180, partial [Vampirovibrionales bacterium]
MTFTIGSFTLKPSYSTMGGMPTPLSNTVGNVRQDIQALFSNQALATPLTERMGSTCTDGCFQPAMASSARPEEGTLSRGGSILDLDAVKLPAPTQTLLKQAQAMSDVSGTKKPENPVGKGQTFNATGILNVDSCLTQASQLSDALMAQYQETS